MCFWSRRVIVKTQLQGISLVLLMIGLHTHVWASPGTEVFQGFTQHISAQIAIDKREFSVADTCTVWFYKNARQKPHLEAERIHFIPVEETETNLDCTLLYPQGLVEARKAFGESQQVLSLSLTFFQMVLVGDGDDNQEYSSEEIRDFLEAYGLPFYESQPFGGYLGELVGLFDRIRAEVRFQSLMDGMQTLLAKGYRLSGADQIALNREME